MCNCIICENTKGLILATAKMWDKRMMEGGDSVAKGIHIEMRRKISNGEEALIQITNHNHPWEHSATSITITQDNHSITIDGEFLEQLASILNAIT